MDRKSAAKTLREIGRLLEVKGENPYRVRAFLVASRAVETVEGSLDELVSSGQILELKGVGKGTAAVLHELVSGRRPTALVELEEEIPEGVRDMLSLSGLGPKKVQTLWRELGVESLGELEYACRENRLLELRGFGPASQDAVLEALEFHGRSRERRLIHQAWAAAAGIQEALESTPGVGSVTIAGELRRWAETIAAIDIVVGVEDPDLDEALASSMGEAEAIGDGLWQCRRDGELPVRLWFAPPGAGAAALLRATGDADFVAALEARGLRSATDWEAGACVDESQELRRLGLPWIPPELREGRYWLDRIAEHGAPELVELGDCIGSLHNHTTDSDGAASLEQMAVAAMDRGWRFFGVADHSPAAFYANGVDADRLRSQWQRADAWNAVHPETRVVKGIEADILPDGRLDLPQGCEAGLDYIVASVHSSFRLSEEAQTDRIVAAVSHPACRVLGHPTGRLLLARPGYAVDLARVFDACVEHGVAVEINASPFRLDLDHGRARAALDLGLKLVVNPDAHSIEGLDDLRWGVAVARRAGATAADLVNCAEIDEFLERR
jgi:DNA polymerase (family 10)